jgi:hypothetical protein
VASDDDPQPWISVDVGRPRTFDRVCLREKFNRIRSVETPAEDGGGWRTLFRGADLDALSLCLPEPVTARKVRLLVTGSSKDGDGKFQGSGVQEFDIY